MSKVETDFQDDNEGSEADDNFAGVSFMSGLFPQLFNLFFCTGLRWRHFGRWKAPRTRNVIVVQSRSVWRWVSLFPKIPVFNKIDNLEGEYRDGLRHGTGCYQFVNGAKYDGEWKQGMKHGKGKFRYPDGSWYCGSFKNNQKNGFGKYLYENGDIYEGEWKDDHKHGIGCYCYQETDILMKW